MQFNEVFSNFTREGGGLNQLFKDLVETFPDKKEIILNAQMFTTRAYKSADGGSLDILSFVPRPPDIYIKGEIFNKTNDEPVQAFANINGEKSELQVLEVSAYGEFSTEKEIQEVYTIDVTADGYKAMSLSIDLSNLENDTTVKLKFPLEPLAASEPVEIVYSLLRTLTG